MKRLVSVSDFTDAGHLNDLSLKFHTVNKKKKSNMIFDEF